MSMESLAQKADMSWIRDLRPDPETASNMPNRTSREVRSGHYVRVKPRPLPSPKLVIFSPVMAGELGLSEDACSGQAFLRFFSGETDDFPQFESWATPYALSIMGRPHYNNCPFGNGNGYGDGRAISIGEVVAPSGKRWEMQLKGGGQTPFCRGADGRAVLRSSVREFLASEAMHHLGVSTTRALSLIVSQEETSQRPWYSGRDVDVNPENDPRLSQAPPELRQMLLGMLKQRSGEPDIMIAESCAITCRVAPSFTRIGHLDLFARRASKPNASQEQRQEHEMIVKHGFDREYPEVLPDAPLPERSLAVLKEATRRIGEMVAGWLRVGFCQGNFNCDNCLIAGRTMDYGPFGFIDMYRPGFAKWVGSGDHFAFMNQPQAAIANLTTLSTCLAPLLDDTGKSTLKSIVDNMEAEIENIVNTMWCRKLGFKQNGKKAVALFGELESLMQEGDVDYTILFRQLVHLPKAYGANPEKADAPSLLRYIQAAFYKDQPRQHEPWAEWIKKWLNLLAEEGATNSAGEQMMATNPKYILREHLLVAAYDAAKGGDYAPVHELYQLIRNPYAEQPEMESKYYLRAPSEALNKSGTAVMT